MLDPHRSLLRKLFTSNIFKGSKPFLKPSPFTVLPTALSSRTHLFHTHRFIFFTLPSKPILKIHPFSFKNPGFCSVSDANIHRPVSQLYVESPEEEGLDLVPMKVLRKKMEELGIDSNLCKFGQYDHLICPMCKGGDSVEKSLSLFITQDGNSASWTCFRAKCGWRGNTGASANGNSVYGRINLIPKVKQTREITEKSLKLEPLCNEIRAYFAERMISGETLRRNSVMQRRYGDEIVIAFPYRRNGVLVSCKYRNIIKKFWQERRTEQIFYGLDDIKDANDIIIVEDEMDKLAMEEAGFRNCVSVPNGTPSSFFNEELPSVEKDTKYQYLWNCIEYLEKASCIILATGGDPCGEALAEELACRLGRERCWRVRWPKKNDVDHFKDANEGNYFWCKQLATDGDPPAQALAKELARRLGRERCWRVRWPKKNDVDHFKDANEVLMYMGPGILKEVIENAELYPIKGLFNFRDYFDEIDDTIMEISYELGVSTGWRALNEIYNSDDGTNKSSLLLGRTTSAHTKQETQLFLECSKKRST